MLTEYYITQRKFIHIVTMITTTMAMIITMTKFMKIMTISMTINMITRLVTHMEKVKRKKSIITMDLEEVVMTTVMII